MKKTLIAALTLGLLTTNAFAGWWGDATITSVTQEGPTAYVNGTLTSTGANFKLKVVGDGTADTKKALLAVSLTAKATGSTVNVSAVCANGVCSMWGIEVK